MTLAKAQAVAAAITNAGYTATAEPVRDINGAILSWKVRAHSDVADVPIDTIKTLQDAQLVQGSVRDATYV